MSNYNQYSGYGGNPYGGGDDDHQAGAYSSGGAAAGGGGYSGSGGYGANPYGENPYATDYSQPEQQPQSSSRLGAPPLTHNHSTYSQQTQESSYSQQQGGGAVGAAGDAPAVPPVPQGNVEYVQASGSTLSNADFLSRVEAVKADIRTLTTHVGQIATLHQQSISSADTSGASSSASALEAMVAQTQVLNTSIRDQIKTLETDAARSRANAVKDTQIRQLKSSFTKQLQEYRQEEANYERRYREQIARQYRIVNPDATDSEVQEAVSADWGNEGVFQTALKTNRSATANTVLGNVRARHNDIQKIERTLHQLQGLMEELATTVVLQDAPIQEAERHTANVKQDTEAANVQIDKGIEHARRARRLKWWCFWIVLAIVCILALILGLIFGLGVVGTGGASNK